jgi:hypothetical protein
MTQDDTDDGRLICYVRIAPAKPAEFAIFRINLRGNELTERGRAKHASRHITRSIWSGPRPYSARGRAGFRATRVE